jgi:hypothetical protein
VAVHQMGRGTRGDQAAQFARWPPPRTIGYHTGFPPLSRVIDELSLSISTSCSTPCAPCLCHLTKRADHLHPDHRSARSRSWKPAPTTSDGSDGRHACVCHSVLRQTRSPATTSRAPGAGLPPLGVTHKHAFAASRPPQDVPEIAQELQGHADGPIDYRSR